MLDPIKQLQQAAWILAWFKAPLHDNIAMYGAARTKKRLYGYGGRRECACCKIGWLSTYPWDLFPLKVRRWYVRNDGKRLRRSRWYWVCPVCYDFVGGK